MSQNSTKLILGLVVLLGIGCSSLVIAGTAFFWLQNAPLEQTGGSTDVSPSVPPGPAHENTPENNADPGIEPVPPTPDPRTQEPTNTPQPGRETEEVTPPKPPDPETPAQEADPTDPTDPTDPGAGSGTDPGGDTGCDVDGVTRHSSTHFTLTDAFMDRYIRDQGRAANQGSARWRKNRNQDVVGVRIRNLRCAPRTAGLQNNDVIKAINGQPLTSTSAALSAYSAISRARQFTIKVRRDGQAMTIRYTVE